MSDSGVARDDVRRVTTEVYDSLGDMEHLSTGQRVTIFRQRCAELEKIACKSARRYKLATAEIISLTNRLSNQKLGSNLCPVWVSAVDNTLRRSSNHMLKNKSPMINAHSATKTGGKKRACATCRDIFNMPMSVYKGHRSDSKKCPIRGKPHPQKPPTKRKVKSIAGTKDPERRIYARKDQSRHRPIQGIPPSTRQARETSRRIHARLDRQK